MINEITLILDAYNQTSPIAFYQPQPQPILPAPQLNPLPSNPTVNNYPPLPCTCFVQPVQVPDPLQQHFSFVNSSSSLLSTKDVPLLTGKHDWGLWHSAVRTLILNANLLGHITDINKRGGRLYANVDICIQATIMIHYIQSNLLLCICIQLNVM